MKHVAIFVTVACLATAAAGDVVHFKNGGSIEGQVVPTEDGVVVRLPAGEVRISNAAIARIEKAPSVLDDYQKRLAALKADDADAQAALGAWARAHGLKGQAKGHFEKALALDADHAGAREALGYRKVGGRWLNQDEEMRARGLVKHDGQWMTPEAAGRLEALQAELALARERRIAAEAELEKARQEAQAAQQAPRPADMPTYRGNPYDLYYSTRDLRGSTTIYWAPPYRVPYYTGSYGSWWYYPGGRRYTRHHVR